MKNQMTKRMANRMFTIMAKKGVTTSQICKLLNVSYPDFISATEGLHQFYGKWQKKIAELLEVDREELFREFKEN